jgi:hypothetical protein
MRAMLVIAGGLLLYIIVIIGTGLLALRPMTAEERPWQIDTAGAVNAPVAE